MKEKLINNIKNVKKNVEIKKVFKNSIVASLIALNASLIYQILSKEKMEGDVLVECMKDRRIVLQSSQGLESLFTTCINELDLSLIRDDLYSYQWRDGLDYDRQLDAIYASVDTEVNLLLDQRLRSLEKYSLPLALKIAELKALRDSRDFSEVDKYDYIYTLYSNIDRYIDYVAVINVEFLNKLQSTQDNFFQTQEGERYIALLDQQELLLNILKNILYDEVIRTNSRFDFLISQDEQNTEMYYRSIHLLKMKLQRVISHVEEVEYVEKDISRGGLFDEYIDELFSIFNLCNKSGIPSGIYQPLHIRRDLNIQDFL